MTSDGSVFTIVPGVVHIVAHPFETADSDCLGNACRLRDGECVGLATFIGDVDARASGCDAAVSLDGDYDTRFRHTHRAPVVRRGGRHAGEVGGIRIG